MLCFLHSSSSIPHSPIKIPIKFAFLIVFVAFKAARFKDKAYIVCWPWRPLCPLLLYDARHFSWKKVQNLSFLIIYFPNEISTILSLILDVDPVEWTVWPLQNHWIRTIMALITFTSECVGLHHRWNFEAKHFSYVGLFFGLCTLFQQTRGHWVVPSIAKLFLLFCFFFQKPGRTEWLLTSRQKPAELEVWEIGLWLHCS